MSRLATEVFTPPVVICSNWMLRALARIWVVLLLGAAVLLAAGGGRADEQVERLGKLLKESDDFRVRTQAALALGASKSQDAVAYLCAGLDDSSSSVRAASAAALGRLRKGGADCLQARLKKEKEGGSVWSVIKRALAAVQGAQAAPVPVTIPAGAKYYVAIELSDKSGRAAGEAAGLVRAGMEKAARQLPEVVVVPAGEARGQSEQVMAAHPQLTGFLLATKLQAPQYEGGSLKVRLETAIFTYPGRALKGMYPVGLTQPGVGSPSVAAENELFALAAERVMQKFAQAAGRIQ
jgi:hypothetical protein